MGLLVLLAWAPIALALLVPVRGVVGRRALRAAPYAAIPALIAGGLASTGLELEVPSLLIDARFRLDGVGRTFFLIAAALWSAAGVYAGAHITRRRRRFFFFFLVTMTGNLTLPLAGDAVTFYVFFAMMTFAGFGLIVHEGSAEAARAGRVYVVLAVIGEVFLLVGLLLVVDAAGGAGFMGLATGIAGSERASLITGCLFVGFGIKAGAVPLHVWLPLAHPVAPTPASAVLSGAMIKAGLLGWLRFLPLGTVALPGWGGTILTLGLIAAFFGVVVGLLQRDPKTVLAYSSVSQMGLMNGMVGLALAVPGAAAPVVAAVTLYAAHHGLAKGSLFLSVGITTRARHGFARPLALGGTAIAAIALTGAPLTSGSVAKAGFKQAGTLAPGPWDARLDWLLPIAAGATTLLMLHFLSVVWRHEREDAPVPGVMWAPWLLLVAAVVVFPFAAPGLDPAGGGAELPSRASVATDLAPVLVALGVYLVGTILWRTSATGRPPPTIAPGDILGPVERLLRWIPSPQPAFGRIADRNLVTGLAHAWYRLYADSDRKDRLLRVELALTRWAVAVAILIAVTVLILILLVSGGAS